MKGSVSSSSSSSSTGASLLLFSLFMVFLAFTVALPSPKDDGLLLPLTQEQLNEASSPSSSSSSSSGPVDAWSQCVNIPVLDETCISIEVIPDNLTLIITLTIHNVTLVHTQLSATQICLDQGSLLRLLDLIPVLAPFKTLINYLIKLLNLIPGQVFSVCIEIENLNVTNNQATGCVSLNSTLICWKGKCVYKGNDDFGCFDIHYLESLPVDPSTPSTPEDVATTTAPSSSSSSSLEAEKPQLPPRSKVHVV